MHKIELDSNIVKTAKAILLEKQKMVIVTHHNPDGDAIGTSLALYHFLQAMGKESKVICPNPYPDFLKWLPGNDDVLFYSSDEKETSSLIDQADLIMALDFNVADRLKKLEKPIRKSNASKILIDHHPNPGEFADYILSDSSVSSTAELLYYIIEQWNMLEYINENFASCLYTGIMTDTGSFNYNSSQPYTYHVVSELLKLRINKDKIYDAVYDNYSESRMRLLGYCLYQKMEVIASYHTAFISIDKEELKEFDFQEGDSEGFVNEPLSIKGVCFTAIFIERKDYVKISFRSKGSFPANEFAEKHFNGGGHKNAAGGFSYRSLNETLQRFRDLLKDYREQLDNSI